VTCTIQLNLAYQCPYLQEKGPGSWLSYHDPLFFCLCLLHLICILQRRSLVYLAVDDSPHPHQARESVVANRERGFLY